MGLFNGPNTIIINITRYLQPNNLFHVVINLYMLNGDFFYNSTYFHYAVILSLYSVSYLSMMLLFRHYFGTKVVCCYIVMLLLSI